MNCFQLLFVLIILEVRLIVCLKSKFLRLFLYFFFFEDLISLFWQEFLPALILLHHLLVVNYLHLHIHLIVNQELNFQVYLEHLIRAFNKVFSSELLRDYHIELYIYLEAYHIFRSCSKHNFSFFKSFFWSSLLELISSV